MKTTRRGFFGVLAGLLGVTALPRSKSVVGKVPESYSFAELDSGWSALTPNQVRALRGRPLFVPAESEITPLSFSPTEMAYSLPGANSGER